MMFYFVSIFLGTLLLPALALIPSSSWVKHVIHEKRDTIQRKWIESSPLDPDHIIPARIGLKQSNLDLGVEYLYEM
jgi:tripeptidyl-peptidase I